MNDVKYTADPIRVGPDVQALRSKVELLDSLSQEGFSEIASIARLALHRLEMPDAHQHLDDIANALRTIRSKADDIGNCISCEAEAVGCEYVKERAAAGAQASVTAS